MGIADFSGSSQTNSSILDSPSMVAPPRQPYEKMACVTVGLPARGKTYIARKVTRYLNWLGIPTRVFNVGDYRRRFCGAEQMHNFFDPNNVQAEEARNAAAYSALKDMLRWLRETDGQVAIYDATNTTIKRRQIIREECAKEGVAVLFVESICDDESIILANIKEVKLSSPDYANINDAETAINDFKQRIQHYQDVYEPIQAETIEKDASFVKVYNVGAKVLINRIQSYRQSRIVYFLINLHIKPRSIYIARHGETTHNVSGRIGGDASLSPRGWEFAKALPNILHEIHGEAGPSLTVWTSTLRRTMQTASFLPHPQLQWKALDELDAGVCDGLTYEQIAELHPEDYALRDQDKFYFRYRGGESYADLVSRLEPIIMEVERQENILIIAHQAVLRAILAYYLDQPHSELPYIKIPLHMLIQLTPRAYGCTVNYYKVGIEAVDTYRPRPGSQGPNSPNSINIPSPLQ